MTTAPTAGATFKDRTVWLILFGLLEIFGGLLFLLGMAFMVFLSTASGPWTEGTAAVSSPALKPGMLVGASLMYGSFAAILMTLGVGSILGRRWARTLSLLMGWMALVGGALGTAAMFMTWPHMTRTMERAAGGGPEVPSAILLLPLAIVCFFMIMIPAAIVLFYRSANVRATCEWKDPKPRWTDSRPLPILALVLMLTWGVLTPLYLPMSGGLFLIYGVLLKGAVALFAAVAMAAASAWCAWRIWQLDVRGWWAALIFWLGLGAGGVLAFDPDKQRLLYEEMGIPPEQVELLAEQALPMSAMIPIMTLGLLALLAFFLYCKQFFTGAPEA